MKVGDIVKLGSFRAPENKPISGLNGTVVSYETGGSGGHIIVRVEGHTHPWREGGNFCVHQRNIIKM